MDSETGAEEQTMRGARTKPFVPCPRRVKERLVVQISGVTTGTQHDVTGGSPDPFRSVESFSNARQ